MRMKLVAAAALGAAAVAPAALGGARSVTPAWTTPVALTASSDYSIWEQGVALDSGGDALAVWSGKDGVTSSFRPSGGTWQPAVQLAPCGYGPKVAFDASGTATVAWLQCADGGARVTTAFRRMHTGWSQPVSLSTPGRPASYLQLAVASSGAAVASWSESDGRVSVIQASTRAPTDAATWEPAVQLSTVGADAYDSSPAIDDRGDAIVAWTRGDPAGAIVWSSFRPSGSSWQPAVNLSQPGHSAYDIVAAIRPDAHAVAVWVDDGQVQSAVRDPATASWAAIASPAFRVERLETDPHGDALAVTGGDGITIAELPVGAQAWGQAFRVASQGVYVSSYRVAFDAAGGLVAVWGAQDNTGKGFVSASRRPAGATDWQVPVTLNVASTYSNLYAANYAVDGAGDAVAIFQTPNAASVETAILDSSAPRIAWIDLPRTGRVGQKLTFAAAPIDISAVSFRWFFGDGRRATGASVTHVYKKAGRYAVTLVATDAAGHSATVARTSVRISARR